MAAMDCYSIDTSALVDWWVRYYPPTVFPGVLPRIEQLIASGRLRASREVLDELQRVNDPCFRWAKARPDLFVDSNEDIQRIVRQIMRQYSGKLKPGKGISGADPFVVALAATHAPAPWVVVTAEKPGSEENPKIPFVCRKFQPQPMPQIPAAANPRHQFPSTDAGGRLAVQLAPASLPVRFLQPPHQPPCAIKRQPRNRHPQQTHHDHAHGSEYNANLPPWGQPIS